MSYLKDTINDVKKLKLTLVINFMFSIDTDEEPIMHLKSNNVEIMIKYKLDEIIEQFFELLLSRY